MAGVPADCWWALPSIVDRVAEGRELIGLQTQRQL
jgi:hypothetical protein